MVLGLSMIFHGKRPFATAALGFLAALPSCFNHALFKNLLFLGAGDYPPSNRMSVNNRHDGRAY